MVIRSTASFRPSLLHGTGIKSISDGEFRRLYFHLDWLQGLSGVAVTANKLEDGKEAARPPTLSVSGKLKWTKPIQVRLLLQPSWGSWI